ncbi:MAG: hypothetical protein WD357_08660 [Gracilimonas sp.]
MVQKEEADCLRSIHHPALAESNKSSHSNRPERWITVLPFSVVRPLIHLIPDQFFPEAVGRVRSFKTIIP